ncbi:MAG: SpoIID/LytB domain-containing protein, partial [Thermoanaerobaculia bacterium]
MRHAWTAVFLIAALSGCAAPSTPPPRPAPEAPAVRSQNAMTPIASMPRTIAEPKIRVGLLTDQATAVFPRTTDGYYLVGDAGASTLRRGFTASAPLADATVRFAIQVGSVSDQKSADGLAEKIRTDLGLRVDSIWDTGGGAYRILAGDFATSEDATPVRAQLTDRGYGKDMLVVRRPADQKFDKKIAIVDDEGDRYTIDGESVLVLPIEAQTVTIDKKPYRTASRLHVNQRGLLNVINELNMEDYLFGVVPAEMGPRIYDELEALKAQAVAARTYAVRNLGQFSREGYDICPGPACQAYVGFSGEHELSTRAVTETSGLVLTHQGKPIDALYTSTCGGETSDVSTMFPGRSEPYLKRARCVELDMLSIAGRADSGLLTEQQVN